MSIIHEGPDKSTAQGWFRNNVVGTTIELPRRCIIHSSVEGPSPDFPISGDMCDRMNGDRLDCRDITQVLVLVAHEAGSVGSTCNTVRVQAAVLS